MTEKQSFHDVMSFFFLQPEKQIKKQRLKSLDTFRGWVLIQQ